MSVVLSLKVLSLEKQLTAARALSVLGEQGQGEDAEQDAPGDEPEPETPEKPDSAGLDYQQKYEDLYVTPPTEFITPAAKTVFLTFDDGPSQVTPQVLDALDAAGAKATFFVVGTGIAGREDMLQRMVSSGHTVALHTNSHEYKTIYASVDAYLDDFYQVFTAVKNCTGVAPTIFRFPGGSVNGYNRLVYQQIIAEMTRRGFVYYDWNVDSGDAAGKNVDKDKLVSQVMSQVRSDYSVVLMHDAGAKQTTADALPAILSQLSQKGYVCKALTNSVSPPQFGYAS